MYCWPIKSQSSCEHDTEQDDSCDLRDHLAHANYYAETPAAARQVCQVGRKIRRIQADLLTGIEDQ